MVLFFRTITTPFKQTLSKPVVAFIHVPTLRSLYLPITLIFKYMYKNDGFRIQMCVLITQWVGITTSQMLEEKKNTRRRNNRSGYGGGGNINTRVITSSYSEWRWCDFYTNSLAHCFSLPARIHYVYNMYVVCTWICKMFKQTWKCE